MHVESMRTMGRATQGVRLINLRGSDEIASVAKVEKSDDDESDVDEEGNPIDSENAGNEAGNEAGNSEEE
jgi:DNA gyrase subunit A